MLGSPRIVAIDDDHVHLDGLVNGLSRNGIACLQIHFTGDLNGFKPCPDVRIVFADLHLGTGTPSDYKTDFATITALLENTIKPSGPYFIVLWTQYQDQAPELGNYLDERLGSGVTKPFAVCPLPKVDHIDDEGKIRDRDELIKAIRDIIRASPQVAAMVEWESQVLEAAGRTVSSILDLASSEDRRERLKDLESGEDRRSEKVGKILGRLAVEAVGKDHVDRDPFRAVNDALVPILSDRIARMRSIQIDRDLWRAALTVPERRKQPSDEEAARLNRLVHIADPGDISPTERGAVIPLPPSHLDDFCDLFGIAEKDAAPKSFCCKNFDPDSDWFRWVLVQCQAACDYAQSNPGSVPFYLGLDFLEKYRASKNPPDSTWRGPMFEFNGEIRRLRVNAGFSLTLPSSMIAHVTPLYRLREQILNDLTYHLHSHGARPGMMSFGKR